MLQQSGGQTEIWQATGGTWNQLAYWNTNKELSLLSPSVYFGSSGNVQTVKGYQFLFSNPGTPIYYPLLTLPPSTNGTYDNAVIRGMINVGWGSVGATVFSLQLANRNGLAWRLHILSGQPLANGPISFQVYTQSNGANEVWLAVNQSIFGTAVFDIDYMIDIGPNNNNGSGLNSPTEATNAQQTTTPGGTIAYSSSVPTGGYDYNTIPWFNLSLSANISSYGGGWSSPQYTIDGYGKVTIRGLVQGSGLIAGATNGTVIATVSNNATPPDNIMFSCIGSNSSGQSIYRVDVNPSGQVVLQYSIAGVGGNPTTWLSLDNINYMTY